MNPLDLLLLALMAAAFWLLILRPAKVRRQAQAKLVASLAPGRRVMTAGGIFGTIVAVEAERVRLEVAPGMVLELLPQAIAEVMADAAGDDPAQDALAGAPIGAPAPTPVDPALAPTPADAPPMASGGHAPVDPEAPAGAQTSGEADRG